jgi:hypothetical protein
MVGMRKRDPVLMALGNRVRKIREARHLTQKKLDEDKRERRVRSSDAPYPDSPK